MRRSLSSVVLFCIAGPVLVFAQTSALPLAFEPNAVPADTAATAYLGRTSQFWLELQTSGALLHFDPAHALRLSFKGANSRPRMTSERRLPGVTNYLLGRDASEWRTGVPQFARVRYAEIYPGIDAVYYGTQQQLEYDFVVAAGAHPEKIRLQFEQADQIQIAKDGSLAIIVGGRQIRQPKPLLYQDIAGRRIPVEGAYEWRERAIGFRIGRYDRTQPLVIDPVLAYATYFGGAGDTWANGIAVDASGSLYLAGTTTATLLPGRRRPSVPAACSSRS